MIGDIVRRFRAGVALAVCLGGLAGCAPQPPAPQPQKKQAASAQAADKPPRAELNLSYVPDGPALVIELRNTGQTPIKVDRELVLLVDVTFVAADGSVIDPNRLDGVKPPPDFRGRFITIAPGQKLQRTLSLKEGFERFAWGWGTVMKGDASYHIPTAYVAPYRLPAGAKPASVRVRYEPGGFMYRDCFKLHTGLELDSLGLYPGPLQKQIALPR
jgi:hypothetical protein